MDNFIYWRDLSGRLGKKGDLKWRATQAFNKCCFLSVKSIVTRVWHIVPRCMHILIWGSASCCLFYWRSDLARWTFIPLGQDIPSLRNNKKTDYCVATFVVHINHCNNNTPRNKDFKISDKNKQHAVLTSIQI